MRLLVAVECSVAWGIMPHRELTMRVLFWVGVTAGLALWIASLRRQLRAAQLRGDMYRDAAVRLDHIISGLGQQER
jgi:hypothetical protein